MGEMARDMDGSEGWHNRGAELEGDVDFSMAFTSGAQCFVLGRIR